MRFVIVTGMSGAGKSTTLKMLEDVGYFCVDNLPIALVGKFAELIYQKNREITKAALGIDIRSGQALENLEEVLEEMTGRNFPYEILFLDASNETLIKRYKETRRMHPLAIDERVDKGIILEREKLSFLKEHADFIIDTSLLLTRELKLELEKIFVKDAQYKNLFVTVLSFGFKYGIPNDSDLVFDVRFLPNPYYIEELKPKTGNEKEIRDYVMAFEPAHIFLEKITDMLKFLIPNYILEGKNQLVVSIGCTGGKHRSVTLANEIYERLKKNDGGYGLKIEHRDIEKDRASNILGNKKV
ncbi:MAG: RNase adapter RapZ [Lachnospiraceae bacterium]|nr:RNase adapter RapZ [Lachnospiraceae bacterium]